MPLGVEPPRPPPGPPPRTSRLHSASVLITGSSAVAAILSALAFVTVNWSGSARRAVIGALLGSCVLFLAGMAAAILTAARDTYARGPRA